MSNTALVVTTISSPNQVLKSLASGAIDNQWMFYCIGDKKTPNDFHIDGCLGNKQWVNAYSYFTDEFIWPRGFPLNKLSQLSSQSETKNESRICDVISPVQQFLANGDTDVDAVFRMVLSNEVEFENRELPITLEQQMWCPFNSQSTLWDERVFQLMYLPSHCSFRMTDIWRSFVVQACLWANDWKLSFCNASVFQLRNEHDLMQDFKDEIPGYLNNDLLIQELSKLPLKSGEDQLLNNLLICYERLISLDLIHSNEEKLLEAWADDISKLTGNNRRIIK